MCLSSIKWWSDKHDKRSDAQVWMTRNTQRFHSAWGNLVLSALLSLAYNIRILISSSCYYAEGTFIRLWYFWTFEVLYFSPACLHFRPLLQCQNQVFGVTIKCHLCVHMVIIRFVRTFNLSLKENSTRKKLWVMINALQFDQSMVLMHEALLPSNGSSKYSVYVKRVCRLLHVLAEGLKKYAVL